MISYMGIQLNTVSMRKNSCWIIGYNKLWITKNNESIIKNILYHIFIKKGYPLVSSFCIQKLAYSKNIHIIISQTKNKPYTKNKITKQKQARWMHRSYTMRHPPGPGHRLIEGSEIPLSNRYQHALQWTYW